MTVISSSGCLSILDLVAIPSTVRQMEYFVVSSPTASHDYHFKWYVLTVYSVRLLPYRVVIVSLTVRADSRDTTTAGSNYVIDSPADSQDTTASSSICVIVSVLMVSYERP